MRDIKKLSPWKNLKSDFPASIVVFLVAMPLCLGIALASGAPLFAGIISGIIGGIVVGSLSGSNIGVSGPAAGLAVIVLDAISDLGAYEIFLVAVVIAGILQLIMGFVRAGIIAYFFPNAVIHGMLAGIGIIIFLKQIPHAFGYDAEPEGDFAFFQMDGHTTFSELIHMMDYISPGVMLVTFVSLFIMILWERPFMKRLTFTKIIPGPLVAVVAGILLNIGLASHATLGISPEHMVKVPVPDSFQSFLGNFMLPDFSALSNPQVYITAIILAVVASIETLLSVEAADKLDPLKRVTPANRELKAQGVGNIIAGLVGGLPVTQVIVRTSANVQSGGKTKASTIMHGFLLLLSVIAIPKVLNMIPLGVLAAVLLIVGYKLARPALFKKMYKEGRNQFIPFVVTVVGIVFTDLLMGIALGMIVAVFIILYNNYKVSFTLHREDLENREKIRMVFSEDVTFLNKASILKALNEIPDNACIEIDATNTRFIHPDVIEIIEDFAENAKYRGIEVKTINLYKGKEEEPIRHFKMEVDNSVVP